MPTLTDRLSLHAKLYAGYDAGGTKIDSLLTDSEPVRRSTSDFVSLGDVIQHDIEEAGRTPDAIVAGAAGKKNDNDGTITLTNVEWPKLDEAALSQEFGTEIRIVNDMIITASGILLYRDQLQTPDETLVKDGESTAYGAKLFVSIGTGLGVSFAERMPDGSYMPFATEAGHIGFSPSGPDEDSSSFEHRYSRYLEDVNSRNQHRIPSNESAFAGQRGIDALVDASLRTDTESLGSVHLLDEIETARLKKNGRPTGEILMKFATSSSAHELDIESAQKILRRYGGMIGSALRNYSLVYGATGGVWISGTVGRKMVPYLADPKNSDLQRRMIGDNGHEERAVHAEILDAIPVYVWNDPDVAVKGALAMAKQLGQTRS